MATITKEQAQKKQALAPDGWFYDWKHYVIWNENQLIRNIEQPDGSVIRATISWTEGQTERKHDFGYSYHFPSGTYNPELSVSRWTRCKTNDAFTNDPYDAWTSNDYHSRLLAQPEITRKNYKMLCKYAALVSDEQIMEAYNLRKGV